MNHMFRSATFKLTVWYLAIITFINLIFSIVIYRFATGELSIGLHHQTQRIYHDFPVFVDNPLLRSTGEVASGAHHLLWRLVYFNFIVAVLAGIAGYFLARRTLEPIEAAHARQKRFTADVSHELRTPLTALKMGTEVALMDPKASREELRAALTSNLEEAGVMERLINNLLRLTRLDADAVQANFTSLKSTALVTEALQQVSKLADSKQISFEVTGKDSPINGDHDSLVQVLVILLDNAIKYSPPSSTIIIETAPNGSNTLISIRDHGAGMDPDTLPHVFDRFYRADNSRTSSTTDGFGLGLSIAKLITDNHHGTITLTSRQGKGTTAIVSLPSISRDNVR